MENPPAPSIVKIPPPIWTMAMLLIAAGLQWSFPQASIIVAQSVPAAILLFVGGIALAFWAERSFAAVGTEILPASPQNKVLVISGPFQFSRNPMYLGLITALFGVALFFGTAVFFAVPFLVFLLVNFVFIPFEEAKMARQFGNQYTEYRARVRRWL